jgi:DNA-binding transcriptional ArsR family regulator
MKAARAVRIFESLSSPVRLQAYRTLVRRGPAGMVAGEIAQALGLPPANASFHLKAMTQAGLITVEQEGRFQRYRADLGSMLDLVGYITNECCGGHPELCAPRQPVSRRAGKRAP